MKLQHHLGKKVGGGITERGFEEGGTQLPVGGRGQRSRRGQGCCSEGLVEC